MHEQKPSPKVISLLLIDDDKDNAELIRLNLRSASLDVTTVSTPREALKLLGSQKFDCVVSDYMMPGMDGIRLCAEIRKTNRIPFIIYTAYDSEEVAQRALSAGVSYYIRKRSDLEHFDNLASSVKHAVEIRHSS